MSRILVIEDDEIVRCNVLELLEAEGFDGIGAESGEQGVELAVRHDPELIVCDVAMPGVDGFEVFEILSSQASTASIPFIFLSAKAERKDVRRGMALGASDYITKPFSRRELLDSIQTRLRRNRAGMESVSPPSSAGVQGTTRASTIEATGRESEMLVVDDAMKVVLEQAQRTAASPFSVLIFGETGVGKELVAEVLHRHSGRQGRFVAINCAALAESLLESELFGYEKGAFTGALRAREGLFEAAAGGTLFLDEVGDLSSTVQAKLLRVLEAKEVLRIGAREPRKINVRFVSATNRDLERAAAAGEFRQDLLFRLNSVTLTIPPLRSRPADIVPLTERFVALAAQAIGRTRTPSVDEDALAALRAYSWPGNIRELRNVMERAVLLSDGDRVGVKHLPGKFSDGYSAQTFQDPRARLVEEIERAERERIEDALKACGGNQTDAAAMLGVSRRTLVSRLGQYGLPRPRKREGGA